MVQRGTETGEFGGKTQGEKGRRGSVTQGCGEGFRLCDEMDQVIRAQGWKAKITLQIFGKHRVERANRAFGTTCQVHREAVHENWENVDAENPQNTAQRELLDGKFSEEVPRPRVGLADHLHHCSAENVEKEEESIFIYDNDLDFG